MIAASARRLSVFRAAADGGSFNAAAEKLGIAQPSVSAHIAALERQIGQPLFHRGRGSRPRLTEAGETLYAYAAEILKKSEEAGSALAGLRSANRTQIDVAAQRDIAQYFLSPRLPAFAACHPGTRFVTRTGTFENVLDLVRARDVDLGLVVTVGAERGVHTKLLAEEPLVFVAAPHHPLAAKTTVTPKDLAGHPFVTGLRSSRYFRMLDGILKRLGVTAYDVAMEAQDFASVRELVRHGAGIAGMLSVTVADEICSGALKALPLSVTVPNLQIRCAYRPPAAAIVRQFIAYLQKAPDGAGRS